MMSIDREEWVQVRAYYIWESEGRPAGRDRVHWAEAERAFGEDQPAPAATAPKRRSRAAKPQPSDAVTRDEAPKSARKPAAAGRRKKSPETLGIERP